jgi:hypothetical protein
MCAAINGVLCTEKQHKRSPTRRSLKGQALPSSLSGAPNYEHVLKILGNRRSGSLKSSPPQAPEGTAAPSRSASVNERNIAELNKLQEKEEFTLDDIQRMQSLLEGVYGAEEGTALFTTWLTSLPVRVLRSIQEALA